MCDAHHNSSTAEPQHRTSRDAPPHTPPEDVMRHLSAARDILVPLAGIAFFVMLATLVA
jgi:hypothetical protein